jgi:hypothetical protein
MDASEIEDAGYAEHARMDDSLGSTSTDEQLPWDSPDPAADAAQPESEAQQRREEEENDRLLGDELANAHLQLGNELGHQVVWAAVCLH